MIFKKELIRTARTINALVRNGVGNMFYFRFRDSDIENSFIFPKTLINLYTNFRHTNPKRRVEIRKDVLFDS